MSDAVPTMKEQCEDYLRQYHSANVPAPQPEQADKGGDGVRVGEAQQQWTTTRPVEPGRYWVWGINYKRVGMVELVDKHGGLYEEISGLYVTDFTYTTHWLGPLPVPAPPPATVPFVRLPDDPLIITSNCAPDAVLAKLRQMFDDPAWWVTFVREVNK